MPLLTYYQRGDWNSVCDVCGRGFKFSQLRKRWDSAYTCPECWEIRQPQDFVRGVKDDPSVPIARPRQINYQSPFAFWEYSNDVQTPWLETPVKLIDYWLT